MKPLVGAHVPAMTSRKLVAGAGTYVADVKLDRMAHVSIVRAPIAAGRIRSIDSREAKDIPGVLLVVTGDEIAEQIAPLDVEAMGAGVDYKKAGVYPLARGRVRFSGEGVVAVVADDPYTAKHAASLVDIDYEESEAVVDAHRALEEGSALVEPDWGDNVLFHTRFEAGDVDAAFAQAPHAVEGELRHHRYTGAALEPRAYLADYDPHRGELTFWASTQNPHPLRTLLAATLGLAENRVRVVQPNVGGAFGLKIPYFQEEPLIAQLSRLLGRPVRWVAERHEDLLAGGHAREGHFRWSAAYEADGRVTALRVRYVADVGAPSALAGWGMSFVTAFALPGAYKIKNTDVELFSVATNKCPWNAYRGYGKESCAFLMDRVMDAVSRETGLDRAEVRLRNFIQPDEFPYPQNSGAVIDSGDYPKALRSLLELVDYEGFPKLQAEARAEGRFVGIGLGQELTPEGCGLSGSQMFGAYDGATVRISPSSEVTVLTGVTSPGSGNETAIAQITADTLGVDLEQVRVIQGDTESCPYGLGNYSSRGVMMGGSAAHMAATELREKLLRVAGRMLEVATEDLEVERGRIVLRGAPARFISIKDVVSEVYRDCHGAAALEEEPGLESTRYFRHGNIYHQPETQGRYNAYPAWPNQSVACIVEVDPETGMVKVLRYCGVHDSGVVINPLTAEANVHGATAQGIGGALYEQLVYDEGGQLLTTTFMDYTLPTAVELPKYEIAHQETPSPFSPLGMKGVGESGVSGPLGALCGAIESALAEFDVRIDALPLTPEKLWAAIAKAQERSA